MGACRPAAVLVWILLPALHPQSEPEKDLAIELEIPGERTLGPGEHLQWTAWLVNRSKEKTYSVIKTGDGSADGMREPFVYFSATRKNAEGAWEEIPSSWRRECGFYDADWKKDIIQLKPGEKLPLKSWLHSPSSMFELQKPGPVLIRMHYRYQGGRTKTYSPEKGDPDVGLMKGVPPFLVTSEAIEIRVDRPLDLQIKTKRSLKENVPVRLSDLLEIELVNLSAREIEVLSPTLHADARLRLETKGLYLGHVKLDRQESTYGTKAILKKGSQISLLGSGPLANGLDGTWTHPEPGIVNVRAFYHTSTWRPGCVIISDWVEVKVEK